MNREDLDDDIEELDTDISEPEEPEDIPDEDEELLDGQTEYDSMPSDEEAIPEKQHFGEKEYRAQNGDKSYYAKQKEDLDHKIDEAREEKGKDYKKDPKSSEPIQAYGSNTVKKNYRDRIKDNYNLEKAKLERAKAGLDSAKAKTYAALHPGEALKDKAKKTGKSAAKKASKVAAKGAKMAAKGVGRMVAAGGKAVIAFFASNPFALLVAGIAAVLAVIIALLFSSDGDSGTLDGYYDTACDFNLTTVNLQTCSTGSVKQMGLKDYVTRVAYGESEERNYSEAALKALILIVKTNALAKGSYNSSSDKVITINDCDVNYKDNSLVDYFSTRLKKIRKYYSDVENFLFLSESYKDEITNLGSEDVLEFNDTIKDKLATTTLNSYKKILAELYPNLDGNVTTTATNKSFIFIGDSRTVGMDYAVNELNSSNTVAQGSMGYDWFVNTAINSANSLMNDNNSYNIVSWMGVNGLDASASTGENSAINYFNKYKELAQGTWNKHTIYVVPIGPVMDARTYYVKTAAINAFNNKIKELINSSGINNLKYVDISFSISYYDQEGLHYNSSDYQKIFNDIKAKLSSKTLSKNKTVYDMRNYCSYYHFNNGCENGWWWPVGTGNPVGGIYRDEPGPSLTQVYSPFSYYRPLKGTAHLGTDLGGNYDDVVIASRSGTVVYVHNGCPTIGSLSSTCGGGGGNWVKIDHGDGTASVYMHMKLNSIVVQNGQTVRQGEKLGLIGSSGSSTGAHLHFGVIVNGKYQNAEEGYIDKNNTRPTGNCKYNADQAGVCQALKDQGLSDTAVAAIMGNIANEGGFDPTINAPDSGNGRSWGMVMWYNGPNCSSNVCAPANGTCNANAMKCYCQQNNMNWDSIACQTSYLMYQINNSKDNTESWNWYNVVYGDYEVGEMAVLWCQRFERAANCYPNKWDQRRADSAREFLPFVTNGCK